MGYNEGLIKPQEASEVKPGRAARHKNGIINVTKAQSLLKTKMLSTEESIQRAFDQQG
jgi:hypothetical protein